MPNASTIFSQAEKKLIVSAIKEAERNTSGEIRLHVENRCASKPLERAVELFHALKMHETAQRNGVLFYIAVKDKVFAIYGDEGIHSTVPENFWDDIKDSLQHFFEKEEFVNGIVSGIEAAGKQLKKVFPFERDDTNELSDDISFNDDKDA